MRRLTVCSGTGSISCVVLLYGVSWANLFGSNVTGVSGDGTSLSAVEFSGIIAGRGRMTGGVTVEYSRRKRLFLKTTLPE